MTAIRRAGERLRTMVRGAIVAASNVTGGHTRLQVQGFEREILANVVLLLPPGYVANPQANAPVCLLSRSGSADAQYAVGGSIAAEVQSDLAAGEYGIKSAESSVLLRADGLYLSSTQPIYINGVPLAQIVANEITLGASGATLRTLMNDVALGVYNSHTHPVSGSVTAAPTQQMTVGMHSTQTVKAS